MIDDAQHSELELEVMRFRMMERDVTDPLATCLLHEIVVEMEAALQEPEK
jgi:hypothetical protein